MNNHLTASVKFYFKGQIFSASIELDLDQHMDRIHDLYPLLAKSINLDLYSYEYEMMQAEIITYSSPHPLVDEHIVEGVLDFVAFEASWHESRQLEICQKIADKYLSINCLQKHPEVNNALLEAYRLGAKTD